MLPVVSCSMTELETFDDLKWYLQCLEGVTIDQISGSLNFWIFIQSEDACGRAVSKSQEMVTEKLVDGWDVVPTSIDDVEYTDVPEDTEGVVWISHPDEDDLTGLEYGLDATRTSLEEYLSGR